MTRRERMNEIADMLTEAAAEYRDTFSYFFEEFTPQRMNELILTRERVNIIAAVARRIGFDVELVWDDSDEHGETFRELHGFIIHNV